VNLTIPLHTLTGLADRPGELGGIGPVDPWLARDLARAAASHPKTTWCITVTDAQGHAIGLGCARPEPRHHQRKPARPGSGPPGGYGTWRLSTGILGHRDLTAAIEPVATGTCDHRHQASGHDPGAMLRHLTEIRHVT
jgi:hypothetical protein